MRKKIILQQQKKKTVTPMTSSVNNQTEEVAYFNAYLLPLSEKANLQTALNTYGSVRLEQGDYSGSTITMNSNQKLYGHSKLNVTPLITITAGSSNVYIESVIAGSITFESGGVTTNCTVKTVKFTSILGTNVTINNNQFIDISGTINFNCSFSGYFRNNKVIKHQAQSSSNQLVLKGNSTTPSYGNVHLHTNFLTPQGDTSDLDGVQSVNFVGIDGEGWNQDGQGTRSMLYARNMGRMNITDVNGDNGYSAVITGVFDIDAENVLFYNKTANVPTQDLVSNRTNIATFKGEGAYSRSVGLPVGLNLLGHSPGGNLFLYNNVEQTNTIVNPSDIDQVKNSFLTTQYTPWEKPVYETIPDPLGSNWQDNRIGKPDSRTYIQNLIDTNGIAELPEGVFYIASTLTIPLDGLHGILGKGTGKTVICGLTDNFPLITIPYGSTQNFTLSYLTLQGGSDGVYVNVADTQVAYQNLKFVSFRNQTNAIHLFRIFGIDNNFFENVSFINCTRAIYKDPLRPFVDTTTCSYIDKTVFYNCQFLNCTTPLSMIATRADNLNLWYNCKFDNGNIAMDLQGQNAPLIANCQFSNYNGTEVIKSNTLSIYSSIFENNAPTVATINCAGTSIEGSQFLDSVDLFSPVEFNGSKNYIYNSTIYGNVIVAVPNVNYYPYSAIFINSNLSANPTMSKLLVNIKDGVPTVLIDETPNPYPQLLVTQ